MTDDDLNSLLTTLRQAEGYRANAYQDSLWVWTIGYGTNLQELEIDRATAERWLLEKACSVEHECRIHLAWFASLTVARQLAVMEMVYNLGMTKFLRFTKMIRALAAGDYVTARAEALDSAWHQQVGEARATRIADALLNG